MNNLPTRLPLYAKLALIVLGITGLFYALYVGRQIIIPLLFATVIAILLNPVVNFLIKKKINRVISISISLLIVLIIATGLGYFIGSQVSMFSDSIPQFKQKFLLLQNDIVEWVSVNFNISLQKINAWIAQTKKGITSDAIVGKTLQTLKGVLVLILVPVYVFMILYYKPLLLEFISQLFKNENKNTVAEVLAETKSLIQNYIVGLAIEFTMVATLNSIALVIIGIEYAVLLGIVGALLNVIPYIGGVIAIGLTVLVALATKSPAGALWVLVAHLVVQFIDNNFILPKIVASKVRINALVSILVVLIGGALWGVPGMFLSIPLTAIIKVIFDRIDQLKPFGFLLGDNQHEFGSMKLFRKKGLKNSPKD